MRWLTLLLTLMLCMNAVAENRNFKGWTFFDEDLKSPKVLIIRDRTEFEKFQKTLPERAPSKKHPAPLNQDPLGKKGVIDFDTQVLVVVSRSQTISAHPKHLATDTQSDQVVVWFELPERPPEARPYGWGVYRALLLPKNDKPVVVKFD